MFTPILRNQRGSSMVGALMVMMVLGYMGAAVIQISSSDQVQSVHEVHGIQAINVGTAGLEWARRQIDQGKNPDVTDKEFGIGSFTVTSSPDASTVTVVSKVGDAVRSQTISVDFSDDVMAIDVDESETGDPSDSDGIDSDGDGADADSGGGDLSGITLVKDGNSAVTVTQVTLDWNWSECVRKASCSDNYADYFCVAGQISKKDDDADDKGKDANSDDKSKDDDSDDKSKDDSSDDDSRDNSSHDSDDKSKDDSSDDDSRDNSSHDSDDKSKDDDSNDIVKELTRTVAFSSKSDNNRSEDKKYKKERKYRPYKKGNDDSRNKDDDSDDKSKDDDSDDKSKDGDSDDRSKDDDSDDKSKDDHSDDASKDDDSDNKCQGDDQDEEVVVEVETNDDMIEADICTAQKNIPVCHLPSGDPDKAHTIYISLNGWSNGHINHAGDFLGECNSQCIQKDEVDLAVIEACDDDDGGAKVDQIQFGTALVFDAGSIPTVDAKEAGDGETIDILDSTMDEDGEYVFESIHFTKEHPGGGYYKMTVDFADGSQLSKTWVDAVKDEEVQAEQEAAEDAYSIKGGAVTVAEGKIVAVEVLGSAITCGAGGSEIQVSAKLGIDGAYQTLFNGSDVDGGEAYSTTASSDATIYTIQATAKGCRGFMRTLASTDTLHVRTLVDGQQAPKLEGFGGQKPVAEFLASYLDDAGKVVLKDNQVIQLWELGVDVAKNPDSTAADFQDLVVVFTITDG